MKRLLLSLLVLTSFSLIAAEELTAVEKKGKWNGKRVQKELTKHLFPKDATAEQESESAGACKITQEKEADRLVISLEKEVLFEGNEEPVTLSTKFWIGDKVKYRYKNVQLQDEDGVTQKVRTYVDVGNHSLTVQYDGAQLYKVKIQHNNRQGVWCYFKLN